MAYPHKTLLALCLLTAQGTALAQTDTATPIVVSATRTAQTADATLAPMIVISRQEIELSQAQDIAELLRLHAGLDIARNGGPGQATSLFLRGTDSNHTLVMINGVKINPGTIGGAALHNINPEMIERVEIVKGPRSTLYGSEAIGGVINIITRRPAQDSRWELFAGGGSFGSTQGGANLDLRKDTLRAGIHLNRFASDGFPTLSAADIDRGHDNTSVNAYLGRQLGVLDMELSHWQAGGTTEYLTLNYDPVTFLVSGYNPVDQDFLNSATTLKLEAQLGDAWLSTVRLSSIRDELDQNQSTDFSHTQRDTLDWQNDFQASEHHLLSAGVMLTNEDTRTLIYGSGFDQSTDVAALYLQDDMVFDRHHLIVAARHTDHEDFNSHTSGDLEYGYRLDQTTQLSAAIGTGFRAPDSTDRFGYGGNINLRPEESRNIEFGIRKTFADQHYVYLNAFDNRITDLIDYFDPDGWLGMLPGQNQNIAEAHIRGIETGHGWRSGPLSGRLEVTMQNPRDDSDNLLPRRARNTLAGALTYEGSDYRIGMDLIAQDKRKDSAYSSVMNPGYGLVNLHASYSINQAWTVSGKVENLLDKKYVLVDGYNSAERSAFLILRYHGVL